MRRFTSVDEYVRARGGARPIRKILIANNGLSALKGIRSMKEWEVETFEQRVLKFVVMATPEDIKANANFIHHGDEVHEVPGGSNEKNYANVRLIVDLAEGLGCDAVWPGWGHASEFPVLPEKLAERGIQFIGPDHLSMSYLGDKVRASIISEGAGVPTIPWSGTGLSEGIVIDSSGPFPNEVYEKACVTSADDAVEKAKAIGYPIMIKASEGGGGKGIRRAMHEAELRRNYDLVRKEVLGSPIFLMRLAEKNRHLEVQLIADQYNNAVALYSRDCSVQRRHQKIIEEGPVSVAPRSIVREMEKAAVRLSKAVNYQNAGTVEYLYDDGHFYFLELNPRLQVEHPVTEWITNVNLPAIQLQVAMGIPLSRIPCIRKFYGLEPFGETDIDFDEVEPVPPNGHVIAARITAENPQNGFLGTSGSIDELSFSPTRNVWGYFSVRVPGGIHPYSDSQFGHVFAHGRDRNEARLNLIVALSRLNVQGKISNTGNYIMNLIDQEAFRSNLHNTAWLDSLIQEKERLGKPDRFLVVTCGGLFCLNRDWNSFRTAWIRSCERGQHPDTDFLRTEFSTDLIYEDVKYELRGWVTGRNKFIVGLCRSFREAWIKPLSDGGLLVMFGDESHVVYGREDSSGLRITVDGRVCTFEEESDPSRLKASVSGKVTRFLVEDGDRVEAGQRYVEIEVMKMVIQMHVEMAGVIELVASAGSVIDQGDLLAIIDLEDKVGVKTALQCVDRFPETPSSTSDSQKHPHVVVRRALSQLRDFLHGYGCPPELFSEKMDNAINGLSHLMNDDIVLIYQFLESLSVVRAALPDVLKRSFDEILASFHATKKPPPGLMESLYDAYVEIERTHFSNPARKEEFLVQTLPMLEILRLGRIGMESYRYSLLMPLLEFFLVAERPFDTTRPADKILLSMRENPKTEDVEEIWKSCLAHQSLPRNTQVIMKMLELYQEWALLKFNDVLFLSFAGFHSRPYRGVVSLAKELLLSYRLPSFRKTAAEIHRIFQSALPLEEHTPSERKLILDPVVNNSKYGFDALLSFLSHDDPSISYLAVESYVFKAYTAFDVSFEASDHATFEGLRTTAFAFVDDIKKLRSPKTPRSLRTPNIPPFPAVDSFDVLDVETDSRNGFGVVAVFRSTEAVFAEGAFAAMLSRFTLGLGSPEDRNVLTMMVLCEPLEDDAVDPSTLAHCQEVIVCHSKFLKEHDVRRVTLVFVPPMRAKPFFFTFRMKHDYQEDAIYRNLEPTLAFHLQLQKLRNYDCVPHAIRSNSVHIFHASPKPKYKSHVPERFHRLLNTIFVRSIVYQGDMFDDVAEVEFKVALAEKYFVQALDALEHAMASSEIGDSFGNHIFVHYLPIVKADNDGVRYLVQNFQKKYADRLIALRVKSIEMKLNWRALEGMASYLPIRIVITNETRFHTEINIYQEILDSHTGRWRLESIFGATNVLAGQDVNCPYPVPKMPEIKRMIAQHIYDTSYVYDYPFLYERAVKRSWNTEIEVGRALKGDIPKTLVDVVELTLSEDQTSLVESTDIRIGENAIGMVGMRLTLRTPQFPEGQDVVLILNDITFQSGSFGPDEDLLFDLVSKMSRELGIPRIYITGNSGARIGLANELKGVFRVCWVDPENQAKGFNYLYLTPEDFATHGDSVFAEEVTDEGEVRMKIVDIIGKQHGIGVECLQGSGMIAGETSRAYKEVFTLSYVAARTVGIGAYLVRLGQRIIQHIRPPIILTGASALNKLLGKNVYVSHNQLGGTQIMYPNGVTHLVAQTDFSAVMMMVKWLGYIPKVAGGRLPIYKTLVDPIDREAVSLPSASRENYDPRDFLIGRTVDGEFLPGLLDRGSWFETLTGWATSIVVARARLGGIPVGVIAVEQQTKTEIIPADPADDKSREMAIPKAGGVWFPDSAYKTAQAIEDFNRGEQLPLFIFANWRGFSGGQRDMFKEVLKYGSYIVDALVDYDRPIFIYLPPFAELRGGAWVVVDPMINKDCIEMYCDPRSRGGVLEPSGTIEIKFRRADVLKVMHRVDPVLLRLDEELEAAGEEEDVEDVQSKIDDRIKKVYVIYVSIASQFAELHDTPGRMKAKNVVHDIVPFEKSRAFFYWRLRRRILEFEVYGLLDEVRDKMPRTEKDSFLRGLVGEEIWSDNRATVEWYAAHIEDKVVPAISELKFAEQVATVEKVLSLDPEAVLSALHNFVGQSENGADFKKSLLERL